jgi:hypothetical protein
VSRRIVYFLQNRGQLLEYNPFTKRFSAIQRRLQSIEDEAHACSRQLAWYSKFNPGAEVEALAASQRENGRIRSKIEGLKKERAREIELILDLSQNVKLGLNPRWWFSQKRIQNAILLDEARARVAQMNKAISDQDAATENVLQACQQRQAQLNKHRALDSLELRAKFNALELQLEPLHLELASVLVDKERVDALLRAPILAQRDLTNRLVSLEQEVELCESFEERLSSASTSYEKKMVHEECSRAFGGEGRPGRVKQLKQRDIQSVLRNLEKVEARLQRIARLASRPISMLIIDGNNLCYAGREFIGLEPLYALTSALVRDYRVIVVFDASIRKILRMNDQQVADGFHHEVKVHVVASKQTADQTVLEAAFASDTYVISNDRFRDFTDKAAVSGQRLIRHEIVAGRVLIHDLNLAVPFEQVGHRPRDQYAS